MNQTSNRLLSFCGSLALALSAHSQPAPQPSVQPKAGVPAVSTPSPAPKAIRATGSALSPNQFSQILPEVPKGPKQPVLIVLHSRFYDHTSPQYALQRIDTLIPLLRKLRQQFPAYGVSALFEFSGTVSQVLSDLSEHQPELQEVKKAVAEGLIEVGYTGEDEPVYSNRPRPDFLFADTPDKRWLSRNEAAERFLTDYKDPLTGDPIPGLTGGLKRMQEVFGSVAFASGLTQDLGDNSPYVHQLRRLQLNPVLAGFPLSDPNRGLWGSRFLTLAFAKLISPQPTTSPEVFWEDNVLRSSDTAGDTQAVSTDDGPESLQAAFDKMDRSRIHVIRMEIGSYLQFLKKGADGKPTYLPLTWAYNHPSTPEMSITLKPVLDTSVIDDAKKKEQDTLNWLFASFLPSNPGSRFLSVAELRKTTPTSLDADVSGQRLRSAASDLISQFSHSRPTIPSYAQGEEEYFSLADLFGMLSGALAEFNGSGALPSTVRMTNVYGPDQISANPGPEGVAFTVESIARAAAGISGALHDQTWRPIPANMVPLSVTVDGTQLSPGQFLILMAQAYLDPTPGRKIGAERTLMISAITGSYPRRITMEDMGMGWTLKPAAFHLPPLGRAPPPLPPNARVIR